MSDRQARGVEKALQEAEARGEFQNLPGAGKPLPGIAEPLHEDWWLRQKSTRENIGADALPVTIRLACEVDELESVLDGLDSEADVRDRLEQINQRIRAALIGPVDGPPLRFGPLDVEAETAAWRDRRSTPRG